MTFETILKNEVKRLNQARKNNIKINAGNNSALYELNRSTIKAELAKLDVYRMKDIKVIENWTKKLLQEILDLYINNFKIEEKTFLNCYILNQIEKTLKDFTEKRIISIEENKEIFKNLNDILFFSNKELYYKFCEEKQRALYFLYFV